MILYYLLFPCALYATTRMLSQRTTCRALFFFFLLCESQGLNSRNWICWQASLLSELPGCPISTNFDLVSQELEDSVSWTDPAATVAQLRNPNGITLNDIFVNNYGLF